MPIVQMRTRYLKHLGLGSSQLVQLHQDRQLLLHHLVHTKLEFDVPTKVGARYTSRAYYRPIRSNEVRALLVQSLLHHFELHRPKLLQVGQPLQTIVWKAVVQQLYRNENNGQLREYRGASPRPSDPSLLTSQQLQRALQNDPSRQILSRCQPLRRVRS